MGGQGRWETILNRLIADYIILLARTLRMNCGGGSSTIGSLGQLDVELLEEDFNSGIGPILADFLHIQGMRVLLAWGMVGRVLV